MHGVQEKAPCLEDVLFRVVSLTDTWALKGVSRPSRKWHKGSRLPGGVHAISSLRVSRVSREPLALVADGSWCALWSGHGQVVCLAPVAPALHPPASLCGIPSPC